jgi:hypothetical protein
VVDGAFSDCNPLNPGPEEWSDIDFLPFLGANVYTDQTLSPPNLFLMYDLLNHHTPLGPAESFDIRFDVVEGGVLEHYLVKVFGNGTQQVFVDGVLLSDPEGIVGAVGFGPSPANPGVSDVFVELLVPMNVVYSPDIPLFWSTSAPVPRCRPGTPGCEPCPPNDPRCQGKAEERVEVSATIVNANPDGSTTVAFVPIGVTPEQFCDRATGGGILGDLIDALAPFPGPFKNHGEFMRRVTHKTKEALASLINSGVITVEEAGEIHGCVVSKQAKRK